MRIKKYIDRIWVPAEMLQWIESQPYFTLKPSNFTDKWVQVTDKDGKYINAYKENPENDSQVWYISYSGLQNKHYPYVRVIIESDGNKPTELRWNVHGMSNNEY